MTEAWVSTISMYPTNIEKKTKELVSAGWGKTKKAITSPVLLRIPLKIINVRQCERDLIAETRQNILMNLQHMCTRSTKKLVLGEVSVLQTDSNLKYHYFKSVIIYYDTNAMWPIMARREITARIQ